MSLAAIFAQYSALPPSAVEEWTPGTIDNIESSIPLVLAPWSGQSIAAFRKLTARLASVSEKVALLVCDIDVLSDEITKRLNLGGLRGVGETFWIRKGQVVASIRDYTNEDWANSVERNNNILRS